MDRRTFLSLLPAVGMGLAGCRDAGGTGPSARTPPSPPPPPPQPPAYATAADRALGIAQGVARAAEPVSGGVRWKVTEDGTATYPTDLYTGQAGILAYLAEVYRATPDDTVRAALEQGGHWLRAQPVERSPALYVQGSAGRAWAFLALHEALGGAGGPWLRAAAELAPAIAGAKHTSAGDLIYGLPGQGLLLLRLHRLSGDPRWLAAARELGDVILSRAVRAGGGIKFSSFALADGRPVFYTGLSHGSAGTGYFLARLAEALPAGQRGAYLEGALATAAWLDGLARPDGAGVNWYRREPDQMDEQQVQWCHGPPGIGIFYAELYRAAGSPAHLETAKRCAATVDREGARHWGTSQCHGVGGNAGLYLKLHRVTGESSWLAKAREFEEVVWSRRLAGSHYPAWPASSGNRVSNPGLMTGNAGVGWFYLQLAQEGRVGGPVTD